MNKYFAILSVLVMFAFGSCTSVGDPMTKTFEVESGYTALEVDDAFDVYVDTVSEITVTVGENMMPKVVVKKVNNTLKIYLKPFSFFTFNNVGMKVTIPYCADLTSVDLSGSSSLHTEYTLTGDKVEIDLSGASDFYGNIQAGEVEMELSGSSDFHGIVIATEFDLDLSGSSDADIIGNVATLKMDLSGSSSIKQKINGTQYALSCDQCEGEMSGASDAYIHCDNSIKVSLSGASDLHYTGNASTSGCSCSGSSNIIHDVL